MRSAFLARTAKLTLRRRFAIVQNTPKRGERRVDIKFAECQLFCAGLIGRKVIFTGGGGKVTSHDLLIFMMRRI